MNKKVIGYYYEIHNSIFNHYKMKPSELIGAKVQLCFGKIVNSSKLNEEKSDDIIEEMLNQNIAKIVSIDGNTAKIILEHPIPEDIFKKYYSTETPIYE